jgi:hypothetical protein
LPEWLQFYYKRCYEVNETVPRRKTEGTPQHGKKALLLRDKMAVQSTPNENSVITAKFPYEENESDSK